MITIILPNKKKIYQKQLESCSNYKIRYQFKYFEYPKGGILSTIQHYFKRRHNHQKKACNRAVFGPLFNYTLLKYFPDLISADIQDIVDVNIGTEDENFSCIPLSIYPQMD